MSVVIYYLSVTLETTSTAQNVLHSVLDTVIVTGVYLKVSVKLGVFEPKLIFSVRVWQVLGV